MVCFRHAAAACQPQWGTPLRQSRSDAFMVRHGWRRQHLPHLPISADGTPVCGTGPHGTGKGGMPHCHPYRCRAPEEGRPRACGRATCPGPTWLGTSMLVTRPHTAAWTRAAGGSSLLGRIRTGRMRRVPKAQNLSFIILRRILWLILPGSMRRSILTANWPS